MEILSFGNNTVFVGYINGTGGGWENYGYFDGTGLSAGYADGSGNRHGDNSSDSTTYESIYGFGISMGSSSGLNNKFEIID